MSEPSSLTINFFDINGGYEEDVQIDSEKNNLNLESPIRIIEQYLNENKQDSPKKKLDQFITQYTFNYEIKKNNEIQINCYIINNLSVSHECTAHSNAYIVFCNLEKESTCELLDNISVYIKNNGSIGVKTYVIGVFKENIDEDKTFPKIQQLLGEHELDFEYHEMYLCDKDKVQMINKEYSSAESMQDVFSDIFESIYEGKYPHLSHSFRIKEDNEDKSFTKCKIF
jgi:hypothetical protein